MVLLLTAAREKETDKEINLINKLFTNTYMNAFKKSIPGFVFLFCTLFSLDSYAQATVTFNLNLKPQLEDSTFIPVTDVIELVGDLSPLGRNRVLRLRDLAPKDSIYTVEVEFPRRFNQRTLTYNFVLRTEIRGVFRESLPRTLLLRTGTVELDPFYFDAFAW